MRLVCNCEFFFVVANEIARFGGLKFFLSYLSELRVKCVIEFRRFVRISEDQ
jgi:hypothetical protein